VGAVTRDCGGPGQHLACTVASLTYRTRRQREARRADFQRSALVQVRDLLLELSEAMGRVAAARYEVAGRAHVDATAPADERAEQTRSKSLEVHREAVRLLGEQLGKLP
jgi:hypothetical protein